MILRFTFFQRVFSVAIALVLLTGSNVWARKINVLFIGNSYVYTNDLPLLINNIAINAGDTMVYNSSAPGGTTLAQHCTNATTLALIAQANWDFVVLQEQSQLPSFPESQVVSDVYPFAKKLDSLVHKYNACTKTVFYMTWGRKNGDPGNCPTWPPVCTYTGMDSLLQLRYAKMASDNHAWLSPVGKVWRRLRTTNPTIDLYNADESHPSEAGSYAAACSFYTLFFGKNPELSAYDYTLGTSTAYYIRNAAKLTVYDSLTYWRRHRAQPVSNFTFIKTGMNATFTNLSTQALFYKWNFGDNTSSITASPTHTYAANGIYNVCLTAYSSDCDSAVTCKTVNIGNVGTTTVAAVKPVTLYPNPASDNIYWSGDYKSLSYTITDLNGKTILSGITMARQSVSVSNLVSGSYFIELNAGTTLVKRAAFSVIR